MSTKIRFATSADVELVYQFILELAHYEKLAHEVSATAEQIAQTLFADHKGEVLIAEYESEPAGMALFFYTYSTFLGKAGIYLEDLFVRESFRGRGIGKQLISELARICVKNNYGRLEWVVLDWNQPSINFYESLGAKPQNDWIRYRLDGAALQQMGS